MNRTSRLSCVACFWLFIDLVREASVHQCWLLHVQGAAHANDLISFDDEQQPSRGGLLSHALSFGLQAKTDSAGDLISFPESPPMPISSPFASPHLPNGNGPVSAQDRQHPKLSHSASQQTGLPNGAMDPGGGESKSYGEGAGMGVSRRSLFSRSVPSDGSSRRGGPSSAEDNFAKCASPCSYSWPCRKTIHLRLPCAVDTKRSKHVSCMVSYS